MPDLITINVDGKDVQVPAKIQLIEALRQYAKVDTPAFCYHQDLSVAGNCRICLVEVSGPRGFALAISCHMQTAPGMQVKTQISSEKIRKLRKGVMEFLLVNHPLDCPICDKAGECTLQEHYMGQGKHESRLPDDAGKQYKGGADFRFTDVKGVDRGGKKIDLGSTIVLDQERCILCSRCVRFMDEVAKDSQLGLAGRGDHAYITTFPGKPLEHAYDLNVTDICPVGALTGKHFRFQQRVWTLKSVEAIDPSDALGANITIEYNNGRVWRIMPRRNPDVNKSWISNATRLLYQQLAVNRLTDAKVAGRDVTLADGIKAAQAALAGAKRVALVASGHATVEDNAALLALKDALGARAEVFGGSWLTVGKPDGIAMSGDPVANRAGLKALGIADNLDQLAVRAGEFDVVIAFNHDLFAANAAKATALEKIPTRIVLSAWQDATVAKATIAIGVRSWAEIRGMLINCKDRAQLTQACPVIANPELEPAWRVLAGFAGVTWTSEGDAFKAAQARSPRLTGLSYRTIGPMGAQLPQLAAVGA
ncbi:MAG: 2Fe-2S iron-sulfur cluster-binding protein [Planctomycetota bacterium]